jgi:hypothetical protein
MQIRYLLVEWTERWVRKQNILVGSLRECPAGTWFINHFHRGVGFRLTTTVLLNQCPE